MSEKHEILSNAGAWAKEVGSESMKIHKATVKLKGVYKCVYYTKSFPSKKKLIMDTWYRYTDGFEKTEEEFEDFKESIKYKVKLINVRE